MIVHSSQATHLSNTHSTHTLPHVPEITVLGGQEDPLLALPLTVTLGGIVLDNPLNGLTDETRATGDKDDAFLSRHDVMSCSWRKDEDICW
jgi:hypothetical protein